MEIIEVLNPNLIYFWVLLDKFEKTPEDIQLRKQMLSLLEKKTFLEKQCNDLVFSIAGMNFDAQKTENLQNELKDTRSISKESFSFLNELKKIIENYFNAQVKISRDSKNCIKKLNEFHPVSKYLKFSEIPEKIKEFSNILEFLTDFLLQKSKEKSPNNSNNNLEWSEYFLFLLLINYSQYYKEMTIINDKKPDLELLLDFYFKLNFTKALPIFALSDENNVTIEPFAFPDEVHLKIFDLMEINLPFRKNKFIIGSFDKNFHKNPLLFPIFVHETGHLLDMNLLYIENIIINNIRLEYPELYNKAENIITKWIREIIADAIGVNLSGISYMFSLLTYIDTEQLKLATDSHPGLAFRCQIIYSYLMQNEFIQILPTEIQNKLSDMLKQLNKYSTYNSELYNSIENKLADSINVLYGIINEFMQNTDIYTSGEELSVLINKYKDSITNRKKINIKNTDLKQLLSLQSINWLISIS